jgi:transposase
MRMANRRFEMFQIRQVIVRMRLGESDRDIASAGLMGRKKLAQVRRAAGENGWLDPGKALPADDALAGTLGRTAVPQASQSQILPFAEEVLAWHRQGIQATTIHQALVRTCGFTGSYDAVKRFLRRQRKELPSATVMLDHKPGEAAQVGFGAGPKIVDPVTGEVAGTWVFVMTLAFSRHQYAEVVRDQKVETWLGCHRRAFESFGGVPARVVIDNPKCAITRACYHDPEVQRAYAEIAEGYGFLISPCPPREPQKKGIVESGVKYIKNNFMPLRDFRDLADANRQLHDWVMSTAGNRVHGTTRERPLTRFAETERHFLKALPDVAPEVVAWAGVKLHGNCHVQFEKAYYSAPFGLVHQQLWLRAGEKIVQLFHGQTLVAVHPRLRRPGLKSTVAEHLPPEARAYLMRDPQWCLEQSARVGPMCRELVDQLFASKVLDNLRAAQGVLQLGKKYGAARLEVACKRAVDHGTPLYRAVKTILEKGLDLETENPRQSLLPETYRGRSRFCRDTRNMLQ